MKVPIASLAIALSICSPAARADLGINLYGLSYHFDHQRAREVGLDNEVNAGLGVRYRISRGERLDWVFDAGVYHDSGRNTALVAGAGALYHASEHLRLGGALALFDSESYNRGRPVLAPVPLLAIDTRRLTFNCIYVPRISDRNEVATLAFWATWWLR